MRSSSRVLVAGLALLAVLVAATWWTVRSAGPGRALATTAPADAAARAEHTASVLEQPGAADPARAVTSAEATDVGGSDSAASPAAQRAPTGTVVVRVVDAATGNALSGIALRVVRERGGDRLLGTGTTDERGGARFETVEANTVIVEAQRRPPYARAFGAAWLEAGETETVVVAMGAGRTVRGRVVDDTGAPLADARVYADDDYGSRFSAWRTPFTIPADAFTTPADGRFELTALAPCPRQVWIEHGQMAPHSWSQHVVVVRFEDAIANARLKLDATDPAAVEDVGDVVVPRARTWSGRVLDAHGAPVPGAVVSARHDTAWQRQSPFARGDGTTGSSPGFEGFRLREQECLCDAAGEFELRCRPVRPEVSVWTPAGLVQEFAVPDLEPGGRADDLELRFDTVTLLVLELVDGAGQRIRGRHERSVGSTRSAFGFHFDDRLSVSVRGRGVDATTGIGCDPDGLFRVQIDGAARGSSTVRVDMNGYRPVVRDVELGDSGPVRFVLEPLDALRMHVRFEGSVTVDPQHPRRIELHACIEDPAPRRAALEWPRMDEGCCGLGATRSIEVAPGTTECELPVGADRPFFVAARDEQGGWSQTFGPWRPGEVVRDLVIPELPAPVDRTRAVARIRARVTDARSGEPILAFLHFADPTEDAGVVQSIGVRFAVFEPGRDGPRDAPAGTWRISVRSEGYRSPPAREIELAADAERDLGTYALEPLPVVDIALVGADPAAVRVDVVGPDGIWIGSSELAEGALRLRLDVPPRGVATVYESGDAIGSRSQCIAFEYDGGGRLELRLAPWRAIEVRCPVSSPDQHAAQLQVQLVDARYPTGGRLAQQSLDERAPDTDARWFTGWCAAGTHLLRSQSMLLGSSETRVDVPPSGDGAIRLELRPAR